MDSKVLASAISAIKNIIKNGKTSATLEVWNTTTKGITTYEVRTSKATLVSGLKTRNEVCYFLTDLNAELKKLRKQKGFGDLHIEYTPMNLGIYSCTDVPTKVRNLKVCKEFKSLQLWLSKYAKFDLKASDLYSVDTFGKRGRYEESGERSYACENSQWCAKVLSWLREHRKTNDTIQIAIKEYENTEDKHYSEYYETECYGGISKLFSVEVMTPTGRHKAMNTFWA